MMCALLLLGPVRAQQQGPSPDALADFAATRESQSRLSLPPGRFVYTRSETGLLDPQLDRGFVASSQQPRDLSELCILDNATGELFQARTVQPSPPMPYEKLKTAEDLPGALTVRRRDGWRQLELSVPASGHRPQFSLWDLTEAACRRPNQPLPGIWAPPHELARSIGSFDFSKIQPSDRFATKGASAWYARIDENKEGATVVSLEAQSGTGRWLPASVMSVRVVGLKGHQYVSVSETRCSGWIEVGDGYLIPTQRSFRQADLPEKALPALEPREMLPAAIGGLLDSASFKLEAKFELLGYDPDQTMPEAPSPGPGMDVFEYAADANCAVSLVAAYELGQDGQRTPIEIGVPR